MKQSCVVTILVTLSCILNCFHVCHRVGRRALERLYGITLPPPEEWEDADKPPRAYDVLHAYGCKWKLQVQILK